MAQEQLEIPIRALYRQVGCSECNKTGFLGRVPINEVLAIKTNPRSEFKKSLFEPEKHDLFSRINKDTYLSWLDSAKSLLAMGEILLEHVQRIGK